MKTIALTWELGGGLGHITSLLPIARSLKALGHRPVLILREISQFYSICDDEAIEYIQAPIWHSQAPQKYAAINFTETLCHLGYLEKDGLQTLVNAWMSIFEALKVDAFIFNQSPTAQLASRVFNKPKLIYGNSFSIPPAVNPLPAYTFWDSSQDDLARRQHAENNVLNTINSILNAMGCQTIQHLYQLYEAEHTVIHTSAWLDVYGHSRQNQTNYYTSIAPKNTQGMAINESYITQGMPTVFIYLKAGYKHLNRLLEACKASNATYFIYIARLHPTVVQQYSGSNLYFSDKPYRVTSALEHCDAAILHGGNLAEDFLQAGAPVLLLPSQMEQKMSAYRMQEHKAGVLFEQHDNPQKIPVLLKQLLSDPAYNTAAKQLSEKMLADVSGDVAQKAAEIINKSIKSKS